ncbi:MAG: FGGY family carbohydrate kinase [Bacteroidales bacterium]|jgi:xylulokinase|nr:FGGY family carbohydrate kinase [Bacteroidales bacterium]
MFLGFDIGSSSVKVSLVKAETGECVATAFHPKKEMEIVAQHPGWAEQDPKMWWKYTKEALAEVLHSAQIDASQIKAIGISYQMHGLVCVDANKEVIRPAIIWCDSRAAEIGKQAFEHIGAERCLSHMFNSPGNFTASKLKWIKEHEPQNYERIHKIMLPGDYIAMRLTGEIQTTISGLSEGILWDFKQSKVSDIVLAEYGIDSSLIASVTDTFGIQAPIQSSVAEELGLSKEVKVTYRAGDQPNNALSLAVLEPGEIATTAGTSGVVYGVSDALQYDPKSRVNTFAHVNHSPDVVRLGVLLCINGTGILNSWVRRYIGQSQFSYEQMNAEAERIPIGSSSLSVLPFGNGAERIFEDKVVDSHFMGIDFGQHTTAHMFRAIQEGIVFSFMYGMEIMQEIGIQPHVIKAGTANMFLSPIFRETLANVSGASIELYNTDGSIGAARGAAVGYGYYASFNEAFVGLHQTMCVKPNLYKVQETKEAYEKWKQNLLQIIINQ